LTFSWFQRGKVYWVLTWHLGGVESFDPEALLLLQKNDVRDDSAVLLIGPFNLHEEATGYPRCFNHMYMAPFFSLPE
jgi:hypothetical protein